MILARVVLPEPGGPQKMHDPTSPRRMRSPSACPGPSRCSCPRNRSSVFGRMRAAKGSVEPWKRVGSVTGHGKRETGNVLQERGPLARENGNDDFEPRCYVRGVRQLESFDVWRAAQELACSAYGLTMQGTLSKHFALSDQIRRAAISIPANIAEGYALATTAQFIRFLRISLGSTAELLSHLHVLKKLGLSPANDIDPAVALSTRVLSMLVGLLR